MAAAWGLKEDLRLVLASTIEQGRAAKARFDTWVKAANTDETDRLVGAMTA